MKKQTYITEDQRKEILSGFEITDMIDLTYITAEQLKSKLPTNKAARLLDSIALATGVRRDLSNTLTS